ncbi:MAG: hypothetical protein M3R08_02315, partial [Bacteroidota bacterium]|nr:hypothetical protein [Bacteroidota bacterium]
MDGNSVRGRYLISYLFVHVLLLIQHLTVSAQTFNLRVDPFDQLYGESGWSMEMNDNGSYVVFA